MCAKHVFEADLNVGKIRGDLSRVSLMNSDNKSQASTKAVNCTFPTERSKKGLEGSTQGNFTLGSLSKVTWEGKNFQSLT